MKLHLPTPLRKALLSCLAALATLLPVTHASGAATEGLFVLDWVDPLALASDEDDDDDLYGIMPIALTPPTEGYTESVVSGGGTLSASQNTHFILGEEFTGESITVSAAGQHIKLSNETGRELSFSGNNAGEAASLWLAKGLFHAFTAVGKIGQDPAGGIYVSGEAQMRARTSAGGGVGSSHGIAWHFGATSYTVAEGEDERWNNAALVIAESYNMSGSITLEDGAKIAVDVTSSIGSASNNLSGVHIVGDGVIIDVKSGATLTLVGAEVSGSGTSFTINGGLTMNTAVVSGSDTTFTINGSTTMTGLTIQETATNTVFNVNANLTLGGACNISVAPQFTLAAGVTLQLGATNDGNGLFADGVDLTFTGADSENAATVKVIGPASKAGVLRFFGNTIFSIEGKSQTIAGLVSGSTTKTSTTDGPHTLVINTSGECEYEFEGTLKKGSGNLTVQKDGEGTQKFSGEVQTGVMLTLNAGTVEFSGAADKVLTSMAATGGKLKLSSGALTLNLAAAQGQTSRVEAAFTNGATLELARGTTLNVSGGGILNLRDGALAVTGTSGDAVINLTPTGSDSILALAEDALDGISGLKIKINLAPTHYADLTSVGGLIEYLGSVNLNDLLDTTGIKNGYQLSWNVETHALVLEKVGGRLVWNREDETWAEGVGNWQDGETTGAFSQNREVAFEDAAGDSVTLGGAITAGDMTVSGGGTWTFKGDAEKSLEVINLSVDGATVTMGADGGAAFAVTASSVKLTNGAKLTMSTTGEKNLGSISVAEGTEFIITTAEGWGSSDQNDAQRNIVFGSGALVYSGLRDLTDDALKGLIYNTLAKVTSSALRLETLKFADGSDIYFGSGTDFREWVRSVKHIYVEDGSSVGIYSATLNVDDVASRPTLHLSGDGVDGKGALYISDGGRTVKWTIQLDEAARIDVSGDNLRIEAKYDGGGQKMTKSGSGRLVFTDSFSAAGTTGSIDIVGGLLNLEFTGTEELAGYDIIVTNGLLNMASTSGTAYTIRSLAGSTDGTVTSANADGTNRDKFEATLTLSNTHTQATAATFSGNVTSKITISLAADGYWKLGNGANLQGALNIGVGSTVEFVGGSEGRGSVSTLSGSGTLLLTSGTLALSGEPAAGHSITTLHVAGGSLEVALPTLNDGAALFNVTNLIIDTELSLTLTGLTVANVESYDGYRLFGTLDEELARKIRIDGDFGRRTVTVAADGTLQVSESTVLVWDTERGEWSVGGAWQDGETFQNGDEVAFNAASGDTIALGGEIRAASMSISGGGEWTFTGDEEKSLNMGSVSVSGRGTNLTLGDAESTFVVAATSVALTDGAKMTVTTTGSKAFGSISVAEGTEFIITTAAGWGDTTVGAGANVVTGDGTLVYKELGSVSGDVARGLIYNTLMSSQTTPVLAALRLEGNTDLYLDIEAGNRGDGGAHIVSVRDIYVERGASIGINSGSMNIDSSQHAKPTLHLKGDGVDGKGALYISTGERSVTWTIQLDEAARIDTGNGTSLNINAAFNGVGQKLTKSGTGRLVFNGGGFSAAGTTGSIDIVGGSLNFAFSGAEELAGYDIIVTNGLLNMSNQSVTEYTIRSLAGSTDGTVTSGANANGSNSNAFNATLTLSNRHTQADAATFSGNVTSKITISLAADGYWKLGDGVNLQGALNIGEGSTVEFEGGSGSVASVTGSGTLLLSSGTLTLNGATAAEGYSLTRLAVTGGGIEINPIEMAEGVGLLSIGELTIQDVLNITLTGLNIDNAESYRDYKLFNSLPGGLSEKIVIANGKFGRKQLTVDASGVLHIGGGPEARTWNGIASSVWQADSEIANWVEGDHYFYNYDHVTFTENGGTVEIHGAVTTGNMTLAGGEWTFNASGGDAALEVAGTLSVTGQTTIHASVNAPTIEVVGEDSSLVLDGGYTSSSVTVSGAGSLTIRDASLSNGFVLNAAGGETDTPNVTLDGVTLDTAITLNGNVTLTAVNGETFGGKLTLGAGSTLTLGASLSTVGFGDATGDNITINAGTAPVEFTINAAAEAASGDKNITFGANVTLVKTGGGTYALSRGDTSGSDCMITVEGATHVKEGTLSFQGGADLQGAVTIDGGATLKFIRSTAEGRKINGELSGDGNIVAANSAGLEINGGGKLGGRLDLSWGSGAALAQSLWVGGLDRENGSANGNTGAGGRIIATAEDVTLTVGNDSTNYTVFGMTIGSTDGHKLTLKKVGSNTQTIKDNNGHTATARTSAINADLVLEGGVLDISGMSANRTIGGNVTFAGGTLTYGPAALTISGDMTVNQDVTLRSGDVTVEGGLEIANAKTLTIGDGLSYSAASLSASGGGALTLGVNAAVSIGNAGGALLSAVTLGGGSSLSVGGTVNIGTLTATPGATINIGLTGTTATHLRLTNSPVVTGGTITIAVTGEEVRNLLDGASETTYSLFDGGFTSGWEDFFAVEISDAGRLTATLDAQGNLHFINEANTLTWNGGADGTWRNAGVTHGWLNGSDAANFREEDNAVFSGDHADVTTVKVEGGVTAGSVVIESGNAWLFTDDGVEGEDVINAQSFDVKTNAGATIGGSLGVSTNTSVKLGSAASLEVADSAQVTTRDVVMEAGSALTVSGNASVNASSVSVGENATVTISADGNKELGKVTLEEGASMEISNASNWESSVVSGAGTLVFSGITVGVTSANTTADDLTSMIGATLTSTAGEETPNLARLDLKNTNLKLTKETSGAIEANLRAVRELHIIGGSSLGFDGPTLNNSANGSRTLFLEGSGAQGEGALYLTGDSVRTVNWNVTLTGDATVSSGENNVIMAWRGALNADEHTIVKRGQGVLNLEDSFTTTGKAGKFDVKEGVLALHTAEQNADALAGYDIQLEGSSSLGILYWNASTDGWNHAEAYTIHALSGSESTFVGTYVKNSQTVDRDTSNLVRELIISNTDTESNDANTFAGTISGKILITLAAGYEKLSGTFESGAAFAAQGGTLELAGAFQGSHEVSSTNGAALQMGAARLAAAGELTIKAGDNTEINLAGASLQGAVSISAGTESSVDLTGVTRGAGALSVEASGSSLTITGMTLKSGDRVGFSDIPSPNPARVITLAGDTTLENGSTVAFDVMPETTDADSKYIIGADVASYNVTGTLTVDGVVNVKLDAYGRMNDGKVLKLTTGDAYVLMRNIGSAEISNFTHDTSAQGSFKYRLSVENNTLLLSVEEAAGDLTWDNAAGGDWNSSDSNWSADGSKRVFRAGDLVYFVTLAGATGSVNVNVNGENGAAVSVGGITVTGSTSYTIGGSGLTTTVDGDAGLWVGTEDEKFTGVLTLTSANSWEGNNAINSGTVALQNAQALSDVATRLANAELRLDYAGGELLASTLTVQDGTVLAVQDAAVNANIGAATLQAMEGATLTVHRLADSTAGTLTINSADSGVSGTVNMLLTEGNSSAAVLNVRAGTLNLKTDSGVTNATYSVANGVTVADGASLGVGSGVMLKGRLVAGGATLNMAEGSSLSVSGANTAVGTIISDGAAMLSGSDSGSGTAVELLGVNANTSLGGVWNVAQLSQAEGTTLTIADGSVAVSRATAHELVVQDGAELKAGEAAADGEASVKATSLTLGGNPVYGGQVAKLCRGVIAVSGSVAMTNAEVGENAEIIMGGASNVLSGENTVMKGKLTLAPGADLAISGGAEMSGELMVDAGSVVDVVSDKMGGKATLRSNALMRLNNSAATTDITMQMGAQLLGSASFMGHVTVDDSDTSMSPGVFDLGGMGAKASVTLRNLRSESALTGIGNSLTLTGDSTIYLSDSQMDASNALVRFSGAGVASYALADGATLIIDVAQIAQTVMKISDEAVYYVFNTGVSDSNWNEHDVTFRAELYVYDMSVEFNAQDGSLIFRYTGPIGGSNMYEASSDNKGGEMVINSYDDMDGYAGVVLDRGTHVDLTEVDMDAAHEDGLILRNLIGTEDGNLSVLGQGKGRSKVTIRNTVSNDELQKYASDHGLNIENELAVAGDVTIDGADLQIMHAKDNGKLITDSRTLITGNLNITDGDLELTSGVLKLQGGANVEDVVFTQGSNGQLVIDACTAMVGNITVNDMVAGGGAHPEHILIVNDGELKLKSGTSVDAGIVIGDATAEPDALAGKVSVSGKSYVSEKAALHRVVLNLEEGARVTVVAAPAVRAAEPTAGPAVWDVAGMTGSGQLDTTAPRDMNFVVAGADRVFSGNLANYSGTMTFGASDYTQVFRGAVGGDNWNVVNTAGGRVELDLMGSRARNSLDMGSLVLRKGSYTTILMDMLDVTPNENGLRLNSLTIESGADVTIGQYDDGLITLEGESGEWVRKALGTITVVGDKDIAKEGVIWHLKGVRNATDWNVTVDDDGSIYLDVLVNNDNLYAKYADNANSAAGADMLWSVRNAASSGGDLMWLDVVANSLLSGEAAKTPGNVARANRLLAAAAGASTAVLSEALNTDMERQLRAMRNRASGIAYSQDLNSSVWLNAEGSYHKQGADGMLPGYKLNGWGGTVGAHAQVSESAAVGIALTAMYSDIESNDVDRLKGDVDTYYLSAFGQVARGAWRHTFVASIGTASLDVRRTVNYDLGAYTAKGSTDGLSFGLLYEVGYTVPLNEDYSVCLQPVFNVTWRMNRLDGYTERGGNAALHVNPEAYNSVTFGLGARMQAAVGSHVWNRSGMLEGRALVKLDAGDRRGEAETNFASVADAAHGRVRSAERGAVGIELGAGVTVPVSGMSDLFVDLSTELRSDYTNFNATIGYKVNF